MKQTSLRCTVCLISIALCLAGYGRDSQQDHLSETAKQALAARQWDEAARALEQLLPLAPDVAEVHANLGLAYFFGGKATEALASFERARRLNPKLPDVDAMIALSKAELGRCGEAIAGLNSAFDHPPDADIGRLSGLHLLRCLAELKQPEKEMQIGEKLNERFPNDPEILYQLSRVHAERSSELMSNLLRVAPDSAWMQYANAQVQESLDRPEAAAQEYRNALKSNPRMAGVHYKLGRLILSGSRTPDSLAQAKSEFEQELAVAGNNADAEYELGEIDREQARPEAAIARFGSAVRLQPDFVEAQIALAKTLLEQGRAAEALPRLQRAAQVEPRNKVPHYLLGTAYKALGQADRANQEFAAYKQLDSSHSSASSQSAEPDRN